MNSPQDQKKILSIDIGGSGVKACLINQDGKILMDYKKLNTPHPADPENVLQVIKTLANNFQGFDFVSAGFPGYVRDGIVHTAPNLDSESWKLININERLSATLGKPARVVNDADLQGLGIAKGKGLEMIMTLGTGFGTAILNNGILLPHLELAHLPATKSKDFDAYIGNLALKEIGELRWNKRMEKVLHIFRTVVNYDQLFISGGNAKKLSFQLDENVRIISNKEGIVGGAKLWA